MSFGSPTCSLCRGDGYLIEPVGGLAVAKPCTCVPDCPLCGGTGLRKIEQGGVRKMGRCRCQMLPDRIRLFNGAHVPARHAHSSFASFEMNAKNGAAMRKCATQVTKGKEMRGVVLWGPVGRGKTHLMCAMIRQLTFKSGLRVRFVEFSHLINQLKRGFEVGGNAVLMESFHGVDVLCIDELGKGRATDWEMTIVDELVSHSYNELRTLICTTNFAPSKPRGFRVANAALPSELPALADKVGERVFSRLQEMTDFVPLMGDDYRLKR